jgi:hypothetical protein
MGNIGLRLFGAASFAAILAACSGTKIPNSEPGDGSFTPPFAPYAAQWIGYAEATAFVPDGTDQVQLAVDINGNGTLRIGQLTLAPPTDPDVDFPPDWDRCDPSGLWEGISYPLHAAAVTGDRIQLGIDTGDLFGDWCALQTPVPVDQVPAADGGVETSYGCVPPWAFGGNGSNGSDAGLGCSLLPPDGGPPVPVGCEKIALCQPGAACACTAASCSARAVPDGTPPNQYPVDLDATLDEAGTTLTGTLADPGGGTRLNIHLTKQ